MESTNIYNNGLLFGFETEVAPRISKLSEGKFSTEDAIQFFELLKKAQIEIFEENKNKLKEKPWDDSTSEEEIEKLQKEYPNDIYELRILSDSYGLVIAIDKNFKDAFPEEFEKVQKPAYNLVLAPAIDLIKDINKDYNFVFDGETENSDDEDLLGDE